MSRPGTRALAKLTEDRKPAVPGSKPACHRSYQTALIRSNTRLTWTGFHGLPRLVVCPSSPSFSAIAKRVRP